MTQPKCHVSIDLETLSTSPAAVILAIGAVAVCEESGNSVSLYRVCSIDSQKDRQIDPSTLAWWEKQPEEARKVLTEAESPDATPLKDVLHALTDWVGLLGRTHQVYAWGNGSSFDVAILEHAFKNISPFVPWDFRKVRDMRTLWDLCLRLGINPEVDRSGTHHHALDDARFQANIIIASLKAISEASAQMHTLTSGTIGIPMEETV